MTYLIRSRSISLSFYFDAILKAAEVSAINGWLFPDTQIICLIMNGRDVACCHSISEIAVVEYRRCRFIKWVISLCLLDVGCILIDK